MAENSTPAAAASVAAPDRQARIEAVVRIWRDEHIANGAIARDTGCWNQLQTALAPLVASILKEI